MKASLLIAIAALLTTGGQRADAQQPQLKTTYVSLANNANAVLLESPQPGPNSRIVAINTHPDHNNNFNYFIGRELAARGYRALGVNYYGPEDEFEEFLAPVAAAVKYARSLPGVEKVVFATHSGGGPALTFYQEIAEKGPAACQEPSRIYKCRGTGLTGLPKVDGLLLLDINIGAPHRMLSLDPAVDTGTPRKREPSLDLYAAQNGFDAESSSASYPPAFVKRFLAGVHARSERLIADAQARLRAIESGQGPYKDNEPFVIAGMAENSVGARLNLADPRLLSRTRAPHLHLKADGSKPIEIARSTRKPQATSLEDRDTLGETTQNKTVRHYLSFLALRTTPDYELTEDSMKGIDWRSSANSAPGNVENISVPTLVMAGTCAIHIVPLEITFDHSAAKDKEFVAVEGANHSFQPCRPEFGDTRKRTFDYVEAWLSKPGRF
jgi:pimeloyl-ACP methyl ester carboxylesterase